MFDTSKVYRDASQDTSKINNFVIVIYSVKKKQENVFNL